MTHNSAVLPCCRIARGGGREGVEEGSEGVIRGGRRGVEEEVIRGGRRGVEEVQRGYKEEYKRRVMGGRLKEHCHG